MNRHPGLESPKFVRGCPKSRKAIDLCRLSTSSGVLPQSIILTGSFVHAFFLRPLGRSEGSRGAKTTRWAEPPVNVIYKGFKARKADQRWRHYLTILVGPSGLSYQNKIQFGGSVLKTRHHPRPPSSFLLNRAPPSAKVHFFEVTASNFWMRS